MDQTTLLYIMAGFTTVAAIALVIQASLMFGMYKATLSLTERVATMLPKVEALMDTSRVTLEESRATIAEIRQKSNLILDTGHKQIKTLESILSDAAERTSKQMAYAEAVVQDALSRVEDTVGMVHKGVLKPLRGITGIAAGVGAAVQYLLRRSPNPERATLDEEMFI
jgi:F0F1-type ATP synthase membrane subunit b/b'